MRKFQWLIGIVLVASLVLAACGAGAGDATPTAAGEEMVPTAVMEEPTAVMEEPTMAATEPPAAEATMPPDPGAMGDIDCGEVQDGDVLTMLYQWSGQEEERLNQILQPLVDACGIVVQPESTRDQALLDTRVQAGNPPDIAFWNVAQLVQYQDNLVAMDTIGADAASYQDFFVEQGTIGGSWLGLPIKADIKTIIWYSPVVFEASGYEVPGTWEELDALVEQMVADGNVPWSMGFESGDATGWTGSDFIQDILLVTQGPDFVNGIIDGSVPYNDPGVAEAYEIYGKWATDPAYTVGGAEGTLSTPFLNAIYLPFGDPPEAMMIKQSGFVAGEVATQFPDLEYGTDYDFFQVPGAQGVQGGADWMMAFNDTPAVRALVTYLSSEAGGANWAAAGFDLTPNLAGQGNYPDAGQAKRGDILAEAEGFSADIGDNIPGGFGRAEWTAIVSYVNGGDLTEALDQAAQAQQEALAMPQ